MLGSSISEERNLVRKGAAALANAKSDPNWAGLNRADVLVTGKRSEIFITV